MQVKVQALLDSVDQLDHGSLTALLYKVLEALPTAYGDMLVAEYYYKYVCPHNYYVVEHLRSGEKKYFGSQKAAAEWFRELTDIHPKSSLSSKACKGWQYKRVRN